MLGQEGRRVDWQRWAAEIFVLGAGALAVWLFFRYLAGVLLPFLIAWGIGLLVHPLAVRLAGKLRLPKKLCAAVLVLLAVGLVVLLLVFVTDRLVRELRELLALVESDDAAFWEDVTQWREALTDLTGRIPVLRRLWERPELAALGESVNEMVSQALRDMVGQFSSRIPAFAGALVSRIPAFFIGLIVTVVACFYFSLDLDVIHRGLVSLMPAGVRSGLSRFRQQAGQVLRQYARAYLLILLLTFSELYIALSILGVRYALLTAFLTALIDILPVLGIGLVLLPWSVFCLLTRRFYLGFGLLITYVLMTVIREVIEPRVVSGTFGLHPLLTLFAMYVGYRLLGIAGMLLAPLGVIVGVRWMR